PAFGHRGDVDAFHAGAAACHAAGDLHAGIEDDVDRLLVRRDVLRAKRLGREALALEDDVVLPFLEANVERAVAGGGDVLIAAAWPFVCARMLTSESSSATRATKRPSGPLNVGRPPPNIPIPGRPIIMIIASRPAACAATRAAATGRLSSSTTTPLTRATAVA